MTETENDMEISKNELKKIILHRQGLTNPSPDPLTICSKLNGFQAQYNLMPEQAFVVRTQTEAFRAEGWRDELVRCWSIRGTLHVFPLAEIPLYLHQGRQTGQRDVDDLRSDMYLNENEKRYYAEIILAALAKRPRTRNELKIITAEAGLPKDAERSVFNPWGGLIRYLIESGQVYRKYGLDGLYVKLEDYQPWPKKEAELEIARRYFENYGPCTIDDARYYFKRRKGLILEWMEQLDLETITVEGQERFGFNLDVDYGDLPDLLLLSGFDPLLMGYEKTANPFLEEEHMREVFTYTGMVRPSILVGGRIVGTWRQIGQKIDMNLFTALTEKELTRIEHFLKKLEG
jgi:hypothetical protein